jgi:hypothetical protein
MPHTQSAEGTTEKKEPTFAKWVNTADRYLNILIAVQITTLQMI